MSKRHLLTARSSKRADKIEFIPGRIDSPEDFPRPSVHLDYRIVAKSTYLRTIVRSQKDRGLALRIELTGANPKAFEAYTQWLATGFIAIFMRQLHNAHTNAYHSLTWRDCETLLKSHILGSQFGDEKFQDCVMSMLLKYLDPEQGYDKHVCELVFGKQASGVSQKLKCLVIDRMFAGVKEGDELLDFFVKRVLEGQTGDARMVGNCEYHVHGGPLCDKYEGTGGTTANKARSNLGRRDEDIVKLKSAADAVYDSPIHESRKRHSGKPVLESWNSSARSSVRRSFEAIRNDTSSSLGYSSSSESLSLKLHPSILQRGASTYQDEESSYNDTEHDRYCKSRPPSQRQRPSFTLPPLPFQTDIHPSIRGALLTKYNNKWRKSPATTANRKTNFDLHSPESQPSSQTPDFTNDFTSRPSSSIAQSDIPYNWPLQDHLHTRAPTPIMGSSGSTTLRPHSSAFFTPARYYGSISATQEGITPNTSAVQINPPRQPPPYRDRPLPPLPISPPPSTMTTTFAPRKRPSIRMSIRERLRMSFRFSRRSTPSPTQRISPSLRRIPTPYPDHCSSAPSRTSAPERKPAPANALAFLEGYPEYNDLISRARIEDSAASVRQGIVAPVRPVELQGRAVSPQDLLITKDEKTSERPGTA